MAPQAIRNARLALLTLLATFLLPHLARAQQNCINCPCTGTGAIPGAICLPVGGCPTAGQCVNGKVTCVVYTGSVACSECGTGGTRYCSPTSIGTCQRLQASAEVCNRCDDDKDGQVDEGLTGTACTTTSGCGGTSTCSAGISSCNLVGSSRRPCSSCTNGSQACNADSTFGPCQPQSASPETCNGCDDNKNNTVDEGTSGQPCTMSNGCSGISQCQNSVAACVFSSTAQSRKTCTSCGAGGYQVCAGYQEQTVSISACRPLVSRPETCDLCDDDGDGSTLLVRDCDWVGGCSTSSCLNGQWATCTAPRQEECNGADDTCDGRIDETGCTVPTNCACIPRTCSQVPCGPTQPDGCGGVLNCACASSP